MQLFDTVLITAASERQAEAFRRLIARRQEHGLYPREISFEVVADPPGGRAGPGGGTLWALARTDSRGWIVAVVGDTDVRISSFGEDEHGELYISDLASGAVYLITGRAPSPAPRRPSRR